MVDNLAEKVNECLLNRGLQVLFAYNWDREGCPLYRVAGCQLLRGCLSIEVNGRTVETFRTVCYIVGVCCWGVFIKWGSTVYSIGYFLQICKLMALFKCMYFKQKRMATLLDTTCAVLIMIQGAPAKFQFCQTFFYSRFGVKMVKLNDGQYFRLYSMLAYGW